MLRLECQPLFIAGSEFVLACKGNYECCSQIVTAVQLFGVQNILSDEDLITLQDIFITYEMWRFSANFAIFSDRQNFGRRNRVRRIIFKLISMTLPSLLYFVSKK